MRACFKDGFLLAVKNKASFTLRQACLRGASEPTRQPEVMEAGEEASGWAGRPEIHQACKQASRKLSRQRASGKAIQWSGPRVCTSSK